MKLIKIGRFALVTFLAATFLFAGTNQTNAQTNTESSEGADSKITGERKAAIELVIREYILNNPTIIREATFALQAQEAAAEQLRVAEMMGNLENEIYFDPVSPVGGNDKGDVTIVVFFDYHCGYCKSTLPALKGLLEKDPSIRLVYKEFPILGPQSRSAALAALAAGRQGKYPEFHHAMMSAEGRGENAIKDISDLLGLDYSVLLNDMADPKLAEALDRNIRLANTLGINGTPAYIVGSQIIPGAIDIDSLEELVVKERSKDARTTPANKLAGAIE